MGDALEGRQPFRDRSVSEEALKSFVSQAESFGAAACVAIFETRINTTALYGSGSAVAAWMRTRDLGGVTRIMEVREMPDEVLHASAAEQARIIHRELSGLVDSSRHPYVGINDLHFQFAKGNGS